MTNSPQKNDATLAQTNPSTQQAMDLWRLLSQTDLAVSSQELIAVRTIFGELTLSDSNEFVDFYTNKTPLTLGDGINVNKLDVRLHRTKRRLMLTFEIDGACVTLRQIQNRYPKLQLSDAPRGRSMNEKTTWTQHQNGVGTSFGFAEHTPDCLLSVTFSKSE
jgi:hypothetical protein